MGNQTCCCHLRPLDTKSPVPTEEKKNPEQAYKPKKPKKSRKKKKIPQIKENSQNYFSPEIVEFLEKIQPKTSEPSSALLKEDTTDDYSSTLKTSQSNTSFSDNSQIIEEIKLENNVYYVDLPEYTLDQISSLSEREQKEISWLLLQYESTEEEIDGFIAVRKKNRYGIKQHRWLLFTTNSLYLVLPHNFLVCRMRIKIAEIVNVIQSHDNSIFALEIMATERFFAVFYSNRTLDIINAIQSLRYFVTSQFKEVVMVRSEKEMINRTTVEEKPFEQDLVFLNIKADYGYPGEEIVKTIELTMINEQKVKDKVTLIVTNKTIYYLVQKKKLLNFMDFEEVISVLNLNDKNEIIISSEVGDAWLSSVEIDSALHDIIEIYHNATQKDLEIIYVYEDEVQFNPMKKINKSRQRKLPKDFEQNKGLLQANSSRNYNFIDSLVRVL